MKSGFAPVVLTLHVVMTGGVASQVLPAMRSESSVKNLPTFFAAAPSDGQTELTVRWTADQVATGALTSARPAPQGNRFEIVSRKTMTESAVRERDPQVGADELVIVALDAQGREIGWQHVKDPRIIRSEQPGPNGVLRGQILYRGATELVVRVPDKLDAVTLNLYEVVSSGGGFELRACGSIPLR